MFKMWCATVADTPSAGEAGQGEKKDSENVQMGFLLLHAA